MERETIIAALEGLGVRRDRATMYADCYLEYRTASENIARNGVIVAHPRTAAPLQNPYLAVRDKALAKLSLMRDVPAHQVPGLW
jgi:phage terminase small subunit